MCIVVAGEAVLSASVARKSSAVEVIVLFIAIIANREVETVVAT